MRKAISQLTPLQATLWLIFASSLLRLFVAGSAGLCVDEAHYALYGLHLDWSYFDHPPMVGWLQALILQFGESDRALRVSAILLFAASSLVLFRLCDVLFPQDSPWLGFISVALMHSAAMLQLIGLALIPEAPLLLFALLSVLALHAVLNKGDLRSWLWLGICLGLAALSKYTAVTLVPTVLLAFALTRQWGRLRGAGVWLACGISLLCIVPILYWNAQHDWMSFTYQLHHGARNADWQVKRFALSELAQLLVFGPLIVVFGVIALFAAWKERTHLGVGLCVATALPVLLLFGLGSGREITLPHWTALAWVMLMPLAARWIVQHWQRAWVRAVTWGSVVYAVLLLLVMFSEFVHPWIPSHNRPLADLYGWQQAAQRAESLRYEMESSAAAAPVLFVANWTQGSRLAWYARPAPVQVLDDRHDQFDLWFGSPQAGGRGVLVLWPNEDALAKVAPHFDHCEAAGEFQTPEQGDVKSAFSFYGCEGWHE